MPPQQPHERLDALMTARIAELGMSWEDLADASGLHYETIRGLRAGDTARGRPRTRRALSAALSWTPDSVDRIYAGGDPQPLPGAAQPVQLPGTEAAAVPLELSGDEEEIAETIMRMRNPGGSQVPWKVRREMLLSLLSRNDRRAEAGLPGEILTSVTG